MLSKVASCDSKLVFNKATAPLNAIVSGIISLTTLIFPPTAALILCIIAVKDSPSLIILPMFNPYSLATFSDSGVKADNV